MTDTTTLEPAEAEALEILRNVVAEKGRDYVYPPSLDEVPDCLYLDYDTHGRPTGPSCIVGHYFAAKGTQFDFLRKYEGRTAPQVVPHAFPEATQRLIWALDAAQQAQDNRGTWGDALDAFEETLGLKEISDDADL